MARTVLLDHAAEILGMSRRTVYYRIRAGRLQTIRTPLGSQRVLIDSIEALLRAELDRARGRGAAVSGTGPCARCPTSLAPNYWRTSPRGVTNALKPVGETCATHRPVSIARKRDDAICCDCSTVPV